MATVGWIERNRREARAAEIAVIVERQRLEMIAAMAADVRAAGL